MTEFNKNSIFEVSGVIRRRTDAYVENITLLGTLSLIIEDYRFKPKCFEENLEKEELSFYLQPSEFYNSIEKDKDSKFFNIDKPVSTSLLRDKILEFLNYCEMKRSALSYDTVWKISFISDTKYGACIRITSPKGE